MSAKVKTATGLILLFVFGVISGIAITLIIEGGMINKALANPDRGRQIVANRLTRELKLGPEQQSELEDILISVQDDLQVIREEIEPGIEEILTDSKYQIEEILTTEQKEDFEKMCIRFEGAREQYRKMHRERHRYRGGRGEYGSGHHGPNWQKEE